jgi:hypothetical protein
MLRRWLYKPKNFSHGASWNSNSIAKGAAICGAHRAVLQATYAQYARLDARPHEKTFPTWSERIGIHG